MYLTDKQVMIGVPAKLRDRIRKQAKKRGYWSVVKYIEWLVDNDRI